MDGKIKIDEEGLVRLSNAYRSIGQAMAFKMSNVAAVLQGQVTLTRLRKLPDPWLQVWALHLGSTTRMSTDEAINYIWRKCGQCKGPISDNEWLVMQMDARSSS